MHLKKKTKKVFNQVKSDAGFFFLLDNKSNSIAILMRHLADNMKSRWTDFLTTEGEKPIRNRASEFERTLETTKEELFELWEDGWNCKFNTISRFALNGLLKEVCIGRKHYSVLEAISWQLSHDSMHVGQIIFLAKHFESES